jgi:hypothetical protein
MKAIPFLTINDFEKPVLLQKVELLEAEKERLNALKKS